MSHVPHTHVLACRSRERKELRLARVLLESCVCVSYVLCMCTHGVDCGVWSQTERARHAVPVLCRAREREGLACTHNNQQHNKNTARAPPRPGAAGPGARARDPGSPAAAGRRPRARRAARTAARCAHRGARRSAPRAPRGQPARPCSRSSSARTRHTALMYLLLIAYMRLYLSYSSRTTTRPTLDVHTSQERHRSPALTRQYSTRRRSKSTAPAGTPSAGACSRGPR